MGLKTGITISSTIRDKVCEKEWHCIIDDMGGDVKVTSQICAVVQRLEILKITLIPPGRRPLWAGLRLV